MISAVGILAIERNPSQRKTYWMARTTNPEVTGYWVSDWKAIAPRRSKLKYFISSSKSGCAVEKAQLQDGERLKKYIILKSLQPGMCFIYVMQALVQTAQRSCEAILSREEWTLLYRKNLTEGNYLKLLRAFKIFIIDCSPWLSKQKIGPRTR
jgi:hypothetical protein